MKLLIINYHYLKYAGKKFLKNRGIELNLFQKQLKILKKYYLPIDFKGYQQFSRRKNKENFVIVTFDDGLRDISKASEIARKLQFPLTFFFCSCPVCSKKILKVQKIHLLLEKIPMSQMTEQFYRALKQSQNKIIRKKPKAINLNSVYQYDQFRQRKFKLDLNYLLPSCITELIINQIFKKYFPEEKQISQELYLTLNEIKKLHHQGFEIGGHSCSHTLLSSLSKTEQEKEIKQCRNFLNKITKQPLPFSAPFGHLGTFNQATLQLLKKYRFFNLLTMQRKINTEKTNQFNLGRFDVQDVFQGENLKQCFTEL